MKRSNLLMPGVELFDYQEDALNRMKNGCILNGGVGSGKSRTSLAYFYTLFGGEVNTNDYFKMEDPCDLYIITTARKRDTLEWEIELSPFMMSSDPERNSYKNKVVVDSWNNIKKYVDIHNAFFIFDEQRVVGKGTWVKSFLKIAKNNEWILLSATPGDTWSDYIPVFIANGYYKNRTEFNERHAVFSRYTKYPKIEKYINTGILLKRRNEILIMMDYKRMTVPHHEHIICDYNKSEYHYIEKERWNIFKNKPIENASEYCSCLRELVNSDISRQLKLLDIINEHPKAIIFYNYNYELDILRELFKNYPCSEWNGHKHEKILDGDAWVYLVEYIAGCEGWNCITTDTIIFYSQNYSYRVMQQASGRIDRLNTPYKDLYYYHIRSEAKIDTAIRNTLKRKKRFNESGFAPVFERKENM